MFRWQAIWGGSMAPVTAAIPEVWFIWEKVYVLLFYRQSFSVSLLWCIFKRTELLGREHKDPDIEKRLNSRISEAEEWISELAGRYNGGNNCCQRPLGNIKCTNVQNRGPKEEDKKKWYEKFFEEIIVENFPNMENEIVNLFVPRGTKSPIQDKPKEKHTKTHTNQRLNTKKEY